MRKYGSNLCTRKMVVKKGRRDAKVNFHCVKAEWGLNIHDQV